MTSLAVRGRHMHISWLVSTQCLNMVALCIRKNTRNILVWRARSTREIDCITEELAAVYGKDVLLELYKTAVNDQPYSWLTVKLDAQDRRDMFWLRFEARLLPEDPTIEESDNGRPLGRREGPNEQLLSRGPAAKKKTRRADGESVT